MINYLNKSYKAGFTLLEMLVVVIIIGVLVTMAVPMYERAVEKSHRAEVSITLKRLQEAKLRAMDSMDLSDYEVSPAPSFLANELDSTFQNTADFNYSLYPNATYKNAVCAVRARGKNSGTIFLYLGEEASSICSCPNTNTNTVCGMYCEKGQRMSCYDPNKTANSDTCEAYGMTSVTDQVDCHINIF